MITSNVAGFVVAACLIASSVSAQDVKSLPPGERPFPVTVGAYLIDFQKIDESVLTHTLTGYLTLEWRDTRLAKGAAGPGAALAEGGVTLDQIWSPNIEFMNVNEPRETANFQITIDDGGMVKYEERFKAELSTEFELRHFPFDRQMLLMSIESFTHDASEVILVARQGHQLRNPEAFLPDWFITDVRQIIDTDNHNPDGKPYSRYTFDIFVQRKVGYYIWNVFLPLTFITLLAWAVFFVAPDDLQTRSGVSITALLTAIAFSLVISGTRPRVSYLTFMDAVFLNSYFLIFLTCTSAIASHFKIRKSGAIAAAERVTRLGQVGFPLALLATNGLLVIMFFVL
jgi:neurotransmitter-gated ion-channel